MPDFELSDDVSPDSLVAQINAPSAVNLNAYVRDQLLTICTSETRPPAPVIGRHIYETDTGNEYVWDGTEWLLFNVAATTSAWTSYTPVWDTSGNDPSYGNGSVVAHYRLLGNTIDWRMDLLPGSTTVYGTGAWFFELPTGLTVTSPYSQGVGIALNGGVYWPVQVFADTNHFYFYVPTSQTNLAQVSITGTAPGAWASGDRLWVSATVEVTEG